MRRTVGCCVCLYCLLCAAVSVSAFAYSLIASHPPSPSPGMCRGTVSSFIILQTPALSSKLSD